MNEEALNDSFNLFASQGYNGSIEDYKELMVSNKDARADSYNLFTGEGYNGTDTDFNDLIGVSGQVTLTDEEVGKTNDSANADPSAESNVTDSTSENGSSVSQEKDTAVERLFGKNFITDFAGDLYRSAASGWTQGESLDSAMDIFNDGKNMTEDQYVEFVNQSRAMENAGQTDEMIDFSEQYAKDKEEYGSVGAFFTSWWKNPTVMTQYTAQSLSNMASSAMNSDDAALIAAGGAVAGAAIGTAATPIGTVIGGLAGGMGALSGTMEVGFTTAQLLQEAAVEAGKDWNTMSDTERIDWTKEVVNNKDLYDDLTNKALKRGIAIGAIDAVTGVLSGGAGNLARKTVSTTARSAMAGAAGVAAVAATETTGGLASEIAGQLAADQELNAQEILTEGFADKTFTIINVAKGGLKAPKYTLAGEKMNGKRFREAVQIMDDATIATAELEISNDPLMEKIILNRKTDIKIDQEIDATISGVDDRAEIIKLQKKLNKLKGNDSVTAGNTTKEIKAKITEIQDKYKGSEVDVTIKQRQEAVAKAVDTKFEENFNKYYKGAKKAAKDLGFKQGPKIYKTTKGYEKAIAAKFKFDSFDKYIEAVAKDKNISIEKAAGISRGSDGVFLGEGTMFIDKQKAKEVNSISVASHELLHPVFNAAIGSANAQGKIVREFKKAMTSKQKRFVRNKLRANVEPKDWNTEYLNYFSDAILKGEINYDKNLFEKLKDIVLRILKGAGFDNVSFDSGREVYNFLKEYNTSLKETGQVSEKAVEAIKTAETKRTTKLRKKNANAPEVKAATVGRVGDIQKSVNQEILNLTEALDAAEDAYADDADNPTLLKNVELAEKALDEAEERALSGKPVVVKPKEEKKKVVKKEPKPVRTTNLAPQTAQDKKIMNTYNEGMKDTKRTSFTSSNPLPAKVENKLIPLFEGYINTLVQQKFKQYQSEALEFQDALSILRVEAVNALRTFNPARNENLSGYVRRLIALRQPKMFEKANKEFTSSLEGVDIAGDAGVIRSFANEETVAPESLIKASKVISPKAKNSLVSMLKAWASQNNIDFDLFRFGDVDANATVVVDGKKVTMLHELLKELFPDVNPEKFLDSSTMFTGPEASIVLEKLASNEQELIELFINLLPRGAVMPKGKNKAIVKDANYGKSTKLDKSILTAFYNKGDVSERFTKDAGLIPFTLKDNVRYSDVHKAFGMDSAGNKLNYKRSGKGSAGPVLASAYKMLGRLIMNEVIRTDLGLTAEQKMNVGAGKSDLQFNITQREALENIGVNVDFFKNANTDAKLKAGINLYVKLATKSSFEDFKNYLLPVISRNNPSNDEGNTQLFSGREEFFVALVDYQIRNGLQEKYSTIGVQEIASNKKGKETNYTSTFVIDGKLYTYNFGKTSFTTPSGGTVKIAPGGLASTLAQKASNYNYITKEGSGFIAKIEERENFAKDQKEGLFKLVKDLKKKIDNLPKNVERANEIKLGVFAALQFLKDNKDAIIKTAAKPKFMALINDKNAKYIYEHSQPASVTLGELSQIVFDSQTKKNKFGKNLDENLREAFDEVMDGFVVSLIPEIYDTILKKVGLEYAMPREGTSNLKDYSKKMQKLLEDDLPPRYLNQAFIDAAKKEGLLPLHTILNNITTEDVKTYVYLQTSRNAIETTENAIQAYNKSDLTFSKSMKSEFNQMIEKKSGIDSRGTISQYKAATMGRKKGRFQFFIPPGAEDFEGLMYKLLGKGTEGNEQAAWFKKTLFDPFAIGVKGLDAYKLQVANAVRLLKKSLKNIPKELGKRDPKTDFKYEDAVRVYLWKLNGHEIKGISASDIKALVDIVKGSPKLKKFARELNRTMGGYPAPQESWLAGTITTDAINMVNTIKRAEFLQTWQQNADIIFSEDNLNKLEAAFGKDYVEALKDSLYRMKSGRNRPSGANKLTNKFMNWVNDSVATIMFFNTRSALLQTLSTVNFINWGDNNPVMAAKAFANQKQFWSDFSMLFNSDFLKSRRSGLKNDVNADEIANAAASQTNKAKAALAMLLKAGFLPTQIADSFAIAMGGATFYRNRMENYVKKGMPLKEAKEKAFLDFQEIAEATQQSSRPDRVSQQQASPLGRIILAFANTPMQYMRLTKKAFLDLKNGRGDPKTNVSKILYYAAVQNIIFSSLQAALFATMFDDEEEEQTKKKGVRVANTMLDSMLRGLGIYGAVASTVKNIGLEINKQANKDRPDYSEAAIRALDISPPISSKIRKGRSAGRAFSYKNTREKMKGFGLDNPAYYAVGQITSATANIPLDRAIGKANHIRLAFAQETKFWQSVSLLLGFSEWDLNMIEKDKKKNKFGSKQKWKNVKWKDVKWKSW
mgnify:FL=1